MKRLTVMMAVAALLSVWAVLYASAQTVEPFKDGDSVCFLGDSITKGGLYESYVQLFYATRYPERKISFHNCGVGGDRASAILEGAKFRLDVDVLGHKPAVVTMMLGVNDVERNLYGAGKGGNEKRPGQLRSMAIQRMFRRSSRSFRKQGLRLSF